MCIEQVEKIKIIVSPNPLSDQLMINITDHPEKTSFYIFDLQGNMMFSIDHLPTNQFNVDCKDYVAGVYYYQVKYEDNLVLTGKFIKHRTLLAA